MMEERGHSRSNNDEREMTQVSALTSSLFDLSTPMSDDEYRNANIMQNLLKKSNG